MTTLKKHPIAWTIYSFYLLAWLWLGFNAYINFTSYADGRTIGIHLYTFIIFGFIPYLVITFLISEVTRDQTRKFYILLSRMILAAVPVMVLLGFILNSLFKY